MENETIQAQKCCHGKWHKSGGGAASGVYGLAFLGALVYYIQHAHTFVEGLLGLLKALVWPAMIVYKLLAFLRM
jgi:hypothetical protein